MGVLFQELLRSQAPVQASLQVLQELGEQLKQQVDTSAASAIQSDHLSLTQRLAAVEQALTRQLTALQVKKRFMKHTFFCIGNQLPSQYFGILLY